MNLYTKKEAFVVEAQFNNWIAASEYSRNALQTAQV